MLQKQKEGQSLRPEVFCLEDGAKLCTENQGWKKQRRRRTCCWLCLTVFFPSQNGLSSHWAWPGFWQVREGFGSWGVKVGCKWRWNQQAAFTSWRCGGKCACDTPAGWSGHLWWNVCSDQRKRWGFVWFLFVWVWRRHYLCLEGQQVLSVSGWHLRAPAENGTWSYGRKLRSINSWNKGASIEIIISHHHAGIINSSSAPKPCCNCHTDI